MATYVNADPKAHLLSNQPEVSFNGQTSTMNNGKNGTSSSKLYTTNTNKARFNNAVEILSIKFTWFF